MRITYDPAVDAAYIRLRDGDVVCQAHELSDDIIINLGPHQELVGIEILSASQVLKLDPKSPSVEVQNLTPISIVASA